MAEFSIRARMEGVPDMQASSLSPSSPEWSMLSLANMDPFSTYDVLRERGPIVWDPGMKCWLVLSYALCKEIESDEATYRIMYADASPLTWEIKGGSSSLASLVGEKHARMRRVHLKLFSPSLIPKCRDNHVGPVINCNIDSFANDGHAELVAQLAERVPTQVIASLCGLPWQDDALVARMLVCHKDVMAWVGMKISGDELTRKAKLASDELNEMILPYVLARKDNRGADWISWLWSHAADDYGEVGVEEMLAVTRGLFGAGGHTTTHAIANAIYLFLSDPALREAVTRDQESALNALVEETLRTLGSPQWRFRIANREVSLGDQTVKKDDVLCVLHAAANRDPEHFACPHVVDLKRKRVTDHLAFNVGPRVCPGMHLARLEMRECLKALIRRLPDLRLDLSKEPPRFQNFSHRSFGPLHVLF